MLRIPPHVGNKAMVNTQEHLHYTSLLLSPFAPTLSFSYLLIGFIPSDIFILAKAAMGRLVAIGKKDISTRYCVDLQHVCTEACKQVCMVWQTCLTNTLGLLRSLWSTLHSPFIAVLNKERAPTHSVSSLYETLVATVLMPTQVTCYCSSTFHLIWLISQAVNTLSDCCMPCLVLDTKSQFPFQKKALSSVVWKLFLEFVYNNQWKRLTNYYNLKYYFIPRSWNQTISNISLNIF